MKRESDLMTLREAATLLCVSYRTILSWVRKGVFPRVVYVGPAESIRLYREDVQAQRREISVA